METLAARAALLVALPCLACTSALPMPEEPRYEVDGFRAELACGDAAQCDELLRRADERVRQCQLDYAQYVRETEQRGYGWTGVDRPTCPPAVFRDQAAAAVLAHNAANAQAVAESQAMRARFDADQAAKAAAELAQRAQYAQQRQEQERIAAERAAALQAAALSPAAQVAASVYLCELREKNETITSERSYSARIDRESGTLRPRESRDLAEMALAVKSELDCVARQIVAQWHKPAVPCAQLKAGPLEPEADLLVSNGRHTSLTGCPSAFWHPRD